jgi:hypothetical protein
MKANNLKVSGNKKTKWPKLDSHNQIRLPMTDGDGPYKKTKWPKLDSHNQIRLPMTDGDGL